MEEEEEEESSWDFLDVDDSDILSLLPPPPTLLPHSKPPQNNPNNNNNPNFLSLKSCSQLPPQNQTLDFQSQQNHPLPPHFDHNNKENPSSTSCQRQALIPGPAGAIQTTMNRWKTRNNGEDRIPTQEFLRRYHVDGEEEDVDFKKNSWLSAIEFLRNGEISTLGQFSISERNCVLDSNLNSIKTCITTLRIPLVVAVVKSCKPNGLGDLMVTLKDHTCTVGANIHRKVVTESDFGKDISVGSVLVLQQVAVFSPSSSAQYLNITLRNVVKIIPRDPGPPTKRCEEFRDVLYACPTEESRKDSHEVPEKASSASTVAAERNANEIVKQNSNTVGPRNHNEEELKERRVINGETAKVDEHMIDETDARLNKRPPLEETTNCRSEGFQNASSSETSANHLQNSKNSAETGFKKQKLNPTTSLPEWTDEQLNELFTASWEDDDDNCLL